MMMRGFREIRSWLTEHTDPVANKIAAFVLGVSSVCTFQFDDFTNNFAIVMSIILGFPFFIKRMVVAQEQLQTNQNQLISSQYSIASQLMWSEHLGARIAGIEILWQQLQDNPDERTQRMIMTLFMEFFKNPPEYGSSLDWRDDVNLVINLMREILRQ